MPKQSSKKMSKIIKDKELQKEEEKQRSEKAD